MSQDFAIQIVDDDDSVRTAVSRLLKAAGYTVIGYANAGEYLMADPIENAGCLILDVCMPGPSGMELQEALNRRRNHVPIIFLTGHGDIPMSVRAMKAGAVDFLTKPVQREELLAAVVNAFELKRKSLSETAKSKHVLQLYATLTDKELAVFHYVVEGRLNKQIANLLNMAERTVKAHRAQVMSKLQVSTLADLVRVAGVLAESKGLDGGGS